MFFELSPEIEKVVRQRAEAEGISVNDLLARTFAQESPAASDPKERVQALLALWQAGDYMPTLPPISTRPGETSTQALFRMWEEEDALMTDEEHEAEDRLWEDIEKGLSENGGKLRLRPGAS